MSTTETSSNKGAPRRLSNVQRMDLRKILLENVARGVPISTVADALAKEYIVTTKQIVRDWQRREKWLPLIVHLDKPEFMLQSLFAEIMQARSGAWEAFNLAKANKNENGMVGALRQIHESAGADQPLAEPRQSVPVTHQDRRKNGS